MGGVRDLGEQSSKESGNVRLMKVDSADEVASLTGGRAVGRMASLAGQGRKTRER